MKARQASKVTVHHCGNCGATANKCAECGTAYSHTGISRCMTPACMAVNAPIECLCGYVVSDRGDGVLDYEMKLIPWER